MKNAMVDLENLVQLTNEKPDLVDEPNADRVSNVHEFIFFSYIF